MRSLIFLVASILASLCLLCAACSFEQLEPSVDRNKFAKLNAAAEAVKTGIDSGASLQQVSEKTVLMSDEIAAVKDKVSTKREGRLLKAYVDLLDIYRDGLLLWKYKDNFPHLASELKGRIYMAQDVEPIAAKYGFATESHTYKPTGQTWRSISADSILIIWKNAGDQLNIIRNITNY